MPTGMAPSCFISPADQDIPVLTPSITTITTTTAFSFLRSPLRPCPSLLPCSRTHRQRLNRARPGGRRNNTLSRKIALDSSSSVSCVPLFSLHSIRYLFAGLTLVWPNVVSQTIVATALPTIVVDLGGGNNYSWVGR